jgi:hypothetical protein
MRRTPDCGTKLQSVLGALGGLAVQILLLQADFLKHDPICRHPENLPRILPFTSPEIPATHLEI